MDELVRNLLTLFTVSCAGLCWYLNFKNQKKLTQVKQHKERIEKLTANIKKMMDEAVNTKADYEEAKRVFREAEEKTVKGK